MLRRLGPMGRSRRRQSGPHPPPRTRRSPRLQMLPHLSRLRRLHHDRQAATRSGPPRNRRSRTSTPRPRRTGWPHRSAAQSLTNADWRQYNTYLASRPDEAELQAIRLMIRLCRQYKFHLHIVHLSTALALDDLQKARAEGLPITVETCPHYLHFSAEQIPEASTLHKCAPPIRSKENQQQLWQALRNNVIDMIVTDHSPCPPEMKRLDTGRFDQAWGGIASLSLRCQSSTLSSRTRLHSQRHRSLDEHRPRHPRRPLP